MAEDLQPGWRSTVRQVNGVKLHVVFAGPAGGPLLVLLHGFPEFWWAWRHQIGPLAEAGFRVVVPDMRGYNRSEAPEGVAKYRLDTVAADIVALANSFGAERFHLCGHDWGGVVAWWLAAAHPQHVERLVILNAPHPDVLGRQALAHPTQALRSSYVAFFQLPLLPERLLSARDFALLKHTIRKTARPGTFSEEDLARYAVAWTRPARLTAMLNYYRALRLRRLRVQPAARITHPTLILWGAQDRFLSRHIAEASLNMCDRGRMSVLEDSTHWLHHEEPERVAAEITGFLATASPDQTASSGAPTRL